MDFANFYRSSHGARFGDHFATGTAILGNRSRATERREMPGSLLDYADLRGTALAQETVLRLTLAGNGSGEALFARIDEWLRRKAGYHGIHPARSPGRHGYAGERARLDINRANDRLVVLLAEVDSNVPTRRWVTELDARWDGPSLNIRVTVQQPLDAPYAPRRTPTLIAAAANDPAIGFCDVTPLGSVPSPITGDQVPDLVALVDNPARRLPVLAISVPNVIEPADLAVRLAGAAHVVTLDSEASFALTDHVGRHRSIFHGGIRTYPAGFKWADAPRTAPLWLGSRLGPEQGSLPTIERIVRIVLGRTAGTFASQPLLTIAAIDRQERLTRTAATVAVRDDIANLEAELATLRADRDALQARFDETNLFWKDLEGDNSRLLEQRDDAEQGERQARASEYRWRAELDAMRAASEADELVLEPAAAPAEADAFEAFVADRYRGRLLVSPRARRFYADGEYEDAERLVRVLDAIATDYYDQQRGVEGAHDRWHSACEALHMKHGWSATEIGADDDHKLRWDGKSQLMYHVRSKGRTYDPRRMLYVGFIFDEARQQVVLGRLPSKPATMADHT